MIPGTSTSAASGTGVKQSGSQAVESSSAPKTTRRSGKSIPISLDPDNLRLVEAAATLSGKSVEEYAIEAVIAHALNDRERFKTSRSSGTAQRR